MKKPEKHINDDQAFSLSPPDLSPLSDPVGALFKERHFKDNNPVGIGLRSPHYEDILKSGAEPCGVGVGWLEVHPENYFCGGIHRHYLDQISEHYALSLHAVGLSLGSDQDVNTAHLAQFKTLIDQYDPFIVSDHVSWSASGNAHMNDLLPLPYRQDTLERLYKNVDQTQNYFGRNILVENPSTYIAFKDNEMSEQDFMNALCEKSGCFMLLDINNIFVQSHNHGLDPYAYIDAINPEYVREMHLAGHVEKELAGKQDETHTILVDTHNQRVRDEVWALYEYAVGKIGTVPTLIEWDQDFPPLQTLVDEAAAAREIMTRVVKAENAYAAG